LHGRLQRRPANRIDPRGVPTRRAASCRSERGKRRIVFGFDPLNLTSCRWP
jgi:hypothetical protein